MDIYSLGNVNYFVKVSVKSDRYLHVGKAVELNFNPRLAIHSLSFSFAALAAYFILINI